MTPDSFVRCKNQVLAAIPAAEWRQIEPHLDWVELPLGAMLYEAGVVLQHVYFPATAIVSPCSDSTAASAYNLSASRPAGHAITT